MRVLEENEIATVAGGLSDGSTSTTDSTCQFGQLKLAEGMSQTGASPG